MSLSAIKKSLRSYATPERKKANEWFFKTKKGQYGYGDKFLGIRVPECRTVAKQFRNTSLHDINQLLASPYHEERLTALLILVYEFEHADEQKKTEIYQFYLTHVDRVNNWDLVDLSAPKIIGAYLLSHPENKSLLKKFAQSNVLWERRISIVATFTFIYHHQFSDTMQIAKILLPDTHDLTHKAVGWMLREVWKRNHRLTEDFLQKHYNSIPRTTLRYAIERMPEAKRLKFLKRS